MSGRAKGALTPAQRHAAQREIEKRIREIDAVALRLLLRYLGYGHGQVAYCGNLTFTSQPSLFHSIVFEQGAPATADDARAPRQMEQVADFYRSGDGTPVTVITNAGLLSCRSPLPSYFFQLLGDEDYQGPLIKLLDLLDHTLIDDRLASFRPEWDPELAPDWDGTREDLFRLTAPATPSTLHALFQRVFPELEVAVQRAPTSRAMELPNVVLGGSTLGEAAFGGEAEIPVLGLQVTLLCREAASYEDVPWLREIPRRLAERVLPLLAGTSLHLTVKALLFERGRDAQFDGASRVGENPLPGGDDGLQRTVVFSGPVSETGRADHEHGSPPSEELVDFENTSLEHGSEIL